MSSVMIIAPHALDEVLGCGGIAAAAAEKGDVVTTMFAFGDGTGHDEKRRDAADKVATLLKCESPRFLNMPENRGDTIAIADLIGALEQHISEIGPETVYVPHGGSLHIDHQTTYQAAITAMRPVPGSSVSAIYSYEILSSTDWVPPCDGNAFVPSRFVDISAQLEAKMAAINLYAFDMRDEPHARSAAAVRRLAQLRGSTVGLEAAEGFKLVREVLRS